MKNPFKKIRNDGKLPELIKERVMTDITQIESSSDVADLLVIKNPDIISSIKKKDDLSDSKTINHVSDN